ncbi:hypothetical protein M514_08302 [Trichuris suis]|uniref:Uncharacterized protein n=1 Tax=Trichuris suis TaxID=68888 RepID=A0A085NHJ8_9BILA|nr:hypothetical protein M513_08302 [Trichuris suis]KFD68944.1 hypothetical protein M514_08302 [Trichuris suis]
MHVGNLPWKKVGPIARWNNGTRKENHREQPRILPTEDRILKAYKQNTKTRASMAAFRNHQES